MKRFSLLVLVAFVLVVGCAQQPTKETQAEKEMPLEGKFAYQTKPMLENTGIQVIGIDKVRVSVKPSKDYAGKYIIRPRCDNIGLKLTCGKEPHAYTLKPNPVQVVERGLGIGCPPRASDAGDSAWGEEFIDVVRVPENIEKIVPYYVDCSVWDLFEVRSRELGIPGNAGGKDLNCTIEGTYTTEYIKDPAPFSSRPLPSEADTKYDYCRVFGKVPLKTIRVKLPPADVHLAFQKRVPAGFPEITSIKPWLYEGHTEDAFTNLDLSIISKKPKPKDPTVVWSGNDDDGFVNNSEQSTMTLINGLQLTSGTYSSSYMTTQLPVCVADPPETDPKRLYCVYFEDPEVFVILDPIDPIDGDSMFPNLDSADKITEFFKQISAISDSKGLDINIHPLTQADPTDPRTVHTADNQMAIRITEKPDPMGTSTVLGTSGVGVPNDAGIINIYTMRIREYICELCGGDFVGGECDGGTFGGTTCKSATPVLATGEDLIWEYTKYVAHHEMGHSLNLVVPQHIIYGYHHAPTDDKLFMNPTPAYSKKGKKVTWYLPYQYCNTCIANADLTEN